MKPEAELRRMLARWLQYQYPNVIYRFAERRKNDDG